MTKITENDWRKLVDNGHRAMIDDSWPTMATEKRSMKVSLQRSPKNSRWKLANKDHQNVGNQSCSITIIEKLSTKVDWWKSSKKRSAKVGRPWLSKINQGGWLMEMLGNDDRRLTTATVDDWLTMVIKKRLSKVGQ